jgi:hypothetical protein
VKDGLDVSITLESLIEKESITIKDLEIFESQQRGDGEWKKMLGVNTSGESAYTSESDDNAEDANEKEACANKLGLPGLPQYDELGTCLNALPPDHVQIQTRKQKLRHWKLIQDRLLRALLKGVRIVHEMNMFDRDIEGFLKSLSFLRWQVRSLPSFRYVE